MYEDLHNLQVTFKTSLHRFETSQKCSTDLYKRDPVTVKCSTDLYKRDPVTVKCSRDLYKRDPVTVKCSTDLYKQDPVTVKCSTDLYKRDPVTVKCSTDLYKRDPVTVRRNTRLSLDGWFRFYALDLVCGAKFPHHTTHLPRYVPHSFSTQPTLPPTPTHLIVCPSPLIICT